MQRPSRLAIAIVLMALLAAATAVRAAEKPAVTARLDADTEKVLRALTDHIAGLKSISLEISSEIKVHGEGINQDSTTVHTFQMQRPDRIALTLKSGMQGGTVISDGKTMCVHIPAMKKYTVQDPPKDPTRVLMFGGAGAQFFAVLLKEDPYKAFAEGIIEGKYLGEKKLDGVACHHMRLRQRLSGPQEVNFDVEVWSEKSATPVVRRMMADLSAVSRNAPQFKGKNVVVILDIRYRNWKFNPPIPAAAFTFKPPAGAEKVDSFFGGGKRRPHALLGKAAPDFSLGILDGGQVTLADLKGKSIVILDFWATWCGPCRQVLPIITEVAKEFKDRGVVLFAVNLREQPGKIRAFLKETGIKVTVALDKEGKVGGLYRARGIPQTVIIGKDGSVQQVHVGFAPGLKEQLRSELKALVEGKSLAGNQAQ